jgi:hypothetical protein
MPNAAPSTPAQNNAIARAYVEVIENNHRFALKALEGVTQEQSLRSATPDGSHILWLAGHLAWTYDWLVVQGSAGQPSMLPDGWTKQFSFGTKPSPNADDYLPFAEVAALFEKVARTSLEHFQTWTDDMLDRDLPAEHPGKNFFRTYRGCLSDLCFHDAYHIGQIGILRRVAGASSMFGF